MNIRDEIFNTFEAADYLGVSVQSVRMTTSLKGIKVSRSAVVYTRRELDHYKSQMHLHYRLRNTYEASAEYDGVIEAELITLSEVMEITGTVDSSVRRNAQLQDIEIPFNGQVSLWIRSEVEAYVAQRDAS